MTLFPTTKGKVMQIFRALRVEEVSPLSPRPASSGKLTWHPDYRRQYFDAAGFTGNVIRKEGNR